MFDRFREIPRYLSAIADALEGVQKALERVPVGVAEGGDLTARLDALERGRALWEAEMEAALSRAQQDHRNARAAEERSRYHAARSGDEAADGDDESGPSLEDYGRAYLALYAQGGGDEGVSPMHEGMGGDGGGPRPYYLRAKG